MRFYFLLALIAATLTGCSVKATSDVSRAKELYKGSGVYVTHTAGGTHNVFGPQVATGQTFLINEGDKTITPLGNSGGTAAGEGPGNIAIGVVGTIGGNAVAGLSLRPARYKSTTNVNSGGNTTVAEGGSAQQGQGMDSHDVSSNTANGGEGGHGGSGGRGGNSWSGAVAEGGAGGNSNSTSTSDAGAGATADSGSNSSASSATNP